MYEYADILELYLIPVMESSSKHQFTTKEKLVGIATSLIHVLTFLNIIANSFKRNLQFDENDIVKVRNNIEYSSATLARLNNPSAPINKIVEYKKSDEFADAANSCIENLSSFLNDPLTKTKLTNVTNVAKAVDNKIKTEHGMSNDMKKISKDFISVTNRLNRTCEKISEIING